MHVLHVVGARPNFMKAAPVIRALGWYQKVRQTLVHTGQHYDLNMSDVFFSELGLPDPDINLAVGSASHAQQTAEIMVRFEPVILEQKPELVLVYGDVNSTVAATLVCSKLLVPVGHVEAGLRSFDRTMPEEINRILTDQLSELLFTPSADGNDNLLREGIDPGKIHRVGNVMIDTLVRLVPFAEKGSILAELQLRPRRYGLVTLHRPANVDDPAMLTALAEVLEDLSRNLPVVFPVHPRTRKRLNAIQAGTPTQGVRFTDPLSYLDFLSLQRQATFVITDSGGVQEETTYLGVPCLTVRDNTERPVTITQGTNVLVGRDPERLRFEAKRIIAGLQKRGQVPPLWEGRAAERLAHTVVRWGQVKALNESRPNLF